VPVSVDFFVDCQHLLTLLRSHTWALGQIAAETEIAFVWPHGWNVLRISRFSRLVVEPFWVLLTLLRTGRAGRFGGKLGWIRVAACWFLGLRNLSCWFDILVFGNLVLSCWLGE
jgi:hypothetical protein